MKILIVFNHIAPYKVRLFNEIAKSLKKDKILETQIAIIILSETYYKMENGKKIYILANLKNNQLFHDKEFWNDFINRSILREVQRNLSNNLKYYKENMKSDNKKLENLVFAQILPIIRSMLEFELEEKKINEILEDLLSYYKINNDSKKIIFDMVNFKGTEKQKEIKDKWEKYLELSCILEDETEYKESVLETVKSINECKLRNTIKENKKEEKKEDKKEDKKEEQKEDQKEEEKNNILNVDRDIDEFEVINKKMIVDDVEQEEEEEADEKIKNKNDKI